MALFCKDMSEGADNEEGEADQEDGEVDYLGADVLLVENDHTVEERDYHASTAYHRDDRYHGVGVGEGIEIGEVGRGEEEGDTGNAPAPDEFLACAVRLHQQYHSNAHYDALIQRVPGLHLLREIMAEEVFVVECTDGSEHHRSYRHPYPFGVLEGETFLGSNP